MELNYQQILAEVYDDNAKNLLATQPDYEDDEDREPYEEYDYDGNELPDPDEFNKHHGDRNKPEHVIKPKPAEGGAGTSNLNHKTQIKNLVLNIDGNFRGNVVPATPINCNGTTAEGVIEGTNPSNFVLLTSRLYKNITSVKLTSMEFQNTFYTFSASRGNTSFNVQTNTEGPILITIPDGNYPYLVNQTTGTPYLPYSANPPISNNSVPDVTTLLGAIQSIILRNANTYTSLQNITINYSPQQHKIYFNHPATAGFYFNIIFPSSTTNPNGNGIGYNLGFLQQSYPSIFQEIPPNNFSLFPLGLNSATIIADTAPDQIQDRYVYLQINDWNLVEHQEYGQTHYAVFAKIQLPTQKNTTVFDNNYINSSTKEYIFEQPVNIQRLVISMLDVYGNVLELNGASFSMTIELKQVNDSSVYEKLLEL